MSETEKKRGWWPALVVFEAITLGLGAITGFLLAGSMDVYNLVEKPLLAPPDWAFPVAWGILYALMALAAYLVWRWQKPGWQPTLVLWGVQLAVNLAWPWLFFALEAFGLAFVWLVALWVLVLLLMIRFFRQDRIAGWLLVPYLAWITFAGYLNFMVAYLNP